MSRIPIYDLVLRKIAIEEIPDEPFDSNPELRAVIPESNKVPLDNNVEEPLYNFHLLILKIKELETRLKNLEHLNH